MSNRTILLVAISLGMAGLIYLLNSGPEGPDRQLAPDQGQTRSRESGQKSLPVGPNYPSSSDPTRQAITPKGPAQEDPTTPQTTVPGIVVSGMVRYSGDGKAAGELEFIIRYPGGKVYVKTDQQGHFITEPLVRPGVARIHHRRNRKGGPYGQQLVITPKSVPIQAQRGQEFKLDLTLLRPEAELQAKVLFMNGRPAPGARVQLELVHEPKPDNPSHRLKTATTNENGLVSFAIYQLKYLRAGELIAQLEQSTGSGGTRKLVSPNCRLQLPLRPDLATSPTLLFLEMAGSIRIRIEDTRGSPISGQRIWLSSGATFLSSYANHEPISDSKGEARFEGLSPKEYRIGLINNPSAQERKVKVRAGQESQVRFILPDRRARLAISGRVVDEQGAPLSRVRIHVTYGPRDGDGDSSAACFSDDKGRFTFRATPCDGLTISSDRNRFGDLFNPRSLTLPFGTRDVLFRRTTKMPRERVTLALVDGVTRKRIKGASIIIYRDPYPDGSSYYRAEAGLATMQISHHPGTTLVIECTGYRRSKVQIKELLGLKAQKGIRTIVLNRGLHRWLQVEGERADGSSGPIAGAQVILGTRELGRTNARGEILIDLHEWPAAKLKIAAKGFTPTTWVQADGYGEVAPAYIWLARE